MSQQKLELETKVGKWVFVFHFILSMYTKNASTDQKSNKKRDLTIFMYDYVV